MENEQLKILEEKIQKESRFIKEFFEETGKVVVGQKALLERLLLGLLAGGHVLIEGLPGLAKTLAVKTFAQTLKLKFSRIQFTPDMLPADLTGSLIFDQQNMEFQVKKGPVFANVVLADEINRAPAKVQSALLEAMQERQVTIGDQSYNLETPFMVLATQNMIEQDGTYVLPESQLDRFMLRIGITYPARDEEAEIIKRMSFTSNDFQVKAILNPEHIMTLRHLVNQIYLHSEVEKYILDLVAATRHPHLFGMGELTEFILFGVSPRAAVHLCLASKAFALIQGRGYVRPEDVKEVAKDVLAHRLIENYQARSQNISADDMIGKMLEQIEIP